MKSEIKNFSKSTLCVTRSNTMKALPSILQFVINSEHTNVIMDAPHRFDVGATSCVNEVNAFNGKVNKIIKPYDHASQLNLNIQR